VCKAHFDFLALPARLLESFRVGQGADAITHILVEVAVILRTIAVVHFGFREQVEQSFLLAR